MARKGTEFGLQPTPFFHKPARGLTPPRRSGILFCIVMAKTTAIIPAGGSGQRMGLPAPSSSTSWPAAHPDPYPQGR